MQADADLSDRPAAARTSDLNGPLLAVLCVLLGVFGAHRFYARRIGSGLLQALTFGGLGIWRAAARR